MPQKKKRKTQSREDPSKHDLPPSKAIATEKSTLPQKQANSKRPHSDNDTPRAFSRLFNNHHRPPRSGLDDGSGGSRSARSVKRRKLEKSSHSESTLPPRTGTGTSTSTGEKPIELPQIQRHESLSSFAARVDASLPFKGLSKGTSMVARGHGLVKGPELAIGKEGHRQTRLERKMQRMQQLWREEDTRLKEREREEKEGSYDEEEDDYEYGDGDDSGGKGKKKKKGGGGKRRRKGGGGDGDGRGEQEGDIWAEIKTKRALQVDEKGSGSLVGGLVGLHDVVQAPPRLVKMKIDTNLGSSGNERYVGLSTGHGGLKRKGELLEARKKVVDGYREIMERKKGQEVVL